MQCRDIYIFIYRNLIEINRLHNEIVSNRLLFINNFHLYYLKYQKSTVEIKR